MFKFDYGELIKSPQIEDKLQKIKEYNKELLSNVFYFMVGIWEDYDESEVSRIINNAIDIKGKISTSYNTTQGRIRLTTDLSKKQTIVEFEGEGYENSIK